MHFSSCIVAPQAQQVVLNAGAVLGPTDVAPPNPAALHWVHLTTAYLTTNLVTTLEVITPSLPNYLPVFVLGNGYAPLPLDSRDKSRRHQHR
mgnify:CR=1 FL=1